MRLLIVIAGLSAVVMLCVASYLAGLRAGAASRRRAAQDRPVLLVDRRPEVE